MCLSPQRDSSSPATPTSCCGVIVNSPFASEMSRALRGGENRRDGAAASIRTGKLPCVHRLIDLDCGARYRMRRCIGNQQNDRVEGATRGDDLTSAADCNQTQLRRIDPLRGEGSAYAGPGTTGQERLCTRCKGTGRRKSRCDALRVDLRLTRRGRNSAGDCLPIDEYPGGRSSIVSDVELRRPSDGRAGCDILDRLHRGRSSNLGDRREGGDRRAIHAHGLQRDGSRGLRRNEG